MARKPTRDSRVTSRPQLTLEQLAFHLKKLKEAREQIPDVSQQSMKVRSPEFKTWQTRVRRALEEVFGTDHRYYKDFQNLQFSVPRVAVVTSLRFSGGTGGRLQWDSHDQQAWDRDWPAATALLDDVIEELQTIAAPAPVPATPVPIKPPALTIVLNNNNILQSTTTIGVTQVLDIVDSLQLSESQRDEVRTLVKEFDEGAKANKPMSVLGKCIDGIKVYGPTVFKEVAAPLLLGWMKQHAGIP